MNIYYNPEKFGLSIFAYIQFIPDSYEFNTIVVWIDKNKDLFWYHDSGCSCNTPFDNVGLESLFPIKRSAVLNEIENICIDSRNSRGDPALDKQLIFMDKIKKHLQHIKKNKKRKPRITA